MTGENWHVVYEETSSGVPEHETHIASFDTEAEALDYAVQLNSNEGYDGLPFEGAGDVKGYYVRRSLGFGALRGAGLDDEHSTFCEICGFPLGSSECCGKSGQ